jgi:hypothetical protein
MGSGTSSIARLRKSLVIRAYNLRQPDATIDQQFKSYAKRKDDGNIYISFSDIKTCLQYTNANSTCWLDDLLQIIANCTVGAKSDILYSDFIDFLETGRIPITQDQTALPSPMITSQSDKSISILSFDNNTSSPIQINNLSHNNIHQSSNLPPKTPPVPPDFEENYIISMGMLKLLAFIFLFIN